MEGYLKKWTNVIYRWKPRYFRLEQGVLKYSKYRFTQSRDKILLTKCQILVTPKDKLRFVIRFSDPKKKSVQLRAHSLADKIKWVDALRTAQINELQ